MPVIYDSVHYTCWNILDNIRQNNGIKGIGIGEKELKTSAFDDNTTIYTGNNSSLAHLETQLMRFEKATEIKYNQTKCMGIWLGSNKGNTKKPLGFKWNSGTINNLGYTYGHNTTQTRKKNWEKVRKKVREDIRKWGNLQLSPIGKKILINHVKLSKIWYLAYVEKPSANIIQNIRKDLHDFLWNYRKVRVNRNTIRPLEMRGLAIMDIKTQCEAIQCFILANFLGKEKSKQNMDWSHALAFGSIQKSKTWC